MNKNLLIYKTGAVKWDTTIRPENEKYFYEVEATALRDNSYDCPYPHTIPCIKRFFVGYYVNSDITVWVEQ